eukprot:342001_1
MDWVGIKRAERIMQALLILCAIGSVIYAYLNEWFPYTTYGMVGGFGVACLISVPDWPWFNSNPTGWHKAIDPEKEAKYLEKLQKKKDAKKEKKKKDKKDKTANGTSTKKSKARKRKSDK